MEKLRRWARPLRREVEEAIRPAQATPVLPLLMTASFPDNDLPLVVYRGAVHSSDARDPAALFKLVFASAHACAGRGGKLGATAVSNWIERADSLPAGAGR